MISIILGLGLRQLIEGLNNGTDVREEVKHMGPCAGLISLLFHAQPQLLFMSQMNKRIIMNSSFSSLKNPLLFTLIGYTSSSCSLSETTPLPHVCWAQCGAYDDEQVRS